MMTVGDIQRLYARECVGHRARLVPFNEPNRMAHAVQRREIDERLVHLHAACQLVQGVVGPICKEDRAGLRAQLDDVPRAIVFLIASGTFVLFDDVVVVVVDRI